MDTAAGHLEWEALASRAYEEGVAAGFRNDEEFLYIGLIIRDRARQVQLMTQGCHVWFDSTGSRERTLGVHFPMGSGPPGRMDLRPDVDRGLDQKMLQELLAGMSPSFEIVGRSGPIEQHLSSGDHGIELAMDLDGSSLIYELKIPLRANTDHPYGIGAASGAEIAVGFESPRPERPAGRSMQGGRSGGGRGGAGLPGGGRGGSGGRRGGRGGRGPGGMRGSGPTRGDPPEALELWAMVQLATAEEP